MIFGPSPVSLRDSFMHINVSQSWDTVQKMLDNFFALLPRLVLGLIIFSIFVTLAVSLQWLVKQVALRRHRRANLAILLGRLTNLVVLLVGWMIALPIVAPSFQGADLIKILGIGGLAISFAFKDILQNFLAGILLLLHEPFRIGDQVEVAGFEGLVEFVEARATVIRTYDSRRVVIPNSDLFTKAVIVNTAYNMRRSEYEVGIGYGDDIELAHRAILDAIRRCEGVCDTPPPDVISSDLADYSVILRVRWWTLPPQADVLATKGRVIEAIKTALASNGIDMPFPTQQLLLHDQTEETDGDRARQREGWPAAKSGVPRAGTIARALLGLNSAGEKRRAA
jgi:small conductance mechanosensitive channel